MRTTVPLNIRRTIVRALEEHGGDDGRAALHWLRSVPPEGLTKREVEVVRWIATGLTADEIAQACEVSEKTIRTHTGNILAKLGLRNRVEITLWALRSGVAVLDVEE